MKDVQVEKLKEFHKSYFNPDSINNTASGLKFMSGLRNEDVKEITEPADEFTRHLQKKFTLPLSRQNCWINLNAY